MEVEDKLQTPCMLQHSTIILKSTRDHQNATLPQPPKETVCRYASSPSHSSVPHSSNLFLPRGVGDASPSILQQQVKVQKFLAQIEYHANRSLHYLRMAKELIALECPAPLDKPRKYTLAFLMLSCFIGQFKKINNRLTSRIIKSSAGSFQTWLFDKDVLFDFQRKAAGLRDIMQNKIDGCSAPMKELTDKLLSVRYKTKYPTLPHKYPEIYKLVEDANKSLLFEPISNLTRIASVFFVQECQPLPLETQTQETLHLFLKWTLVANLNNSVSETNYKQSYLLPELVDHLETDAVIAAIKDNLKMMI